MAARTKVSPLSPSWQVSVECSTETHVCTFTPPSCSLSATTPAGLLLTLKAFTGGCCVVALVSMLGGHEVACDYKRICTYDLHC